MDAKAAVKEANAERLNKLRQRVVSETRGLVQFLYESKNAVFRAGSEHSIKGVEQQQVVWPLPPHTIFSMFGVTENNEVVISELVTKGGIFPVEYWDGYELMDISNLSEEECEQILRSFAKVRRNGV